MLALNNLFVSDLINYVEIRWPKLNSFERPILLDELERCVKKNRIRGMEAYIAKKRKEHADSQQRVRAQIDQLFEALQTEEIANRGKYIAESETYFHENAPANPR